MVTLKRWYLSLIQKRHKNPGEWIFFIVLVVLSCIYGACVAVRNFLYEICIFKSHAFNAKIISVGNISWGGTGKTSLVIFLHKMLQKEFCVASVTKGYSQDEYALLKEELGDVVDGKNRVRLIAETKDEFNLFILDDGFQYRELARDVDIVLLKKNEVMNPSFLIPASCFREPLKNIKRADIVIIAHCSPEDLGQIKERLIGISSKLSIFAAEYIPKAFFDLNKKEIPPEYFKGKKVGVLTAIGYPEGFLGTLAKTGIVPLKVYVYPDHYQFSARKIARIEEAFLKEHIHDVVITSKDFHHMQLDHARLNFSVLNSEFVVDKEEEFIQKVKECIGL